MRILLITDTHLAPEATPCTKNWLAAKAFARRSASDLTIHLGDITFDGIDNEEQHDFALAACADWPTPLRFIPGNHDVGDNPPGPGVAASQPLDQNELARYCGMFGRDYWSFEAGPWLIIALDAQLLGSDTPAEIAQWQWLESRLDAARGGPIALLLHKPLFADDPQEAAPHIRYVPKAPRLQLLQRFAKVDLRLVLSGHTHQYLDRVIDGVRHIWVPSAAFFIPDGAQERIGEKVVALGVLELDPAGYSFDLVCPEGMTQWSGSHPILSEMAAHSRSLNGARPAGASGGNGGAGDK
jgi:3',5'-cyclic AMP phosphodiesterase CpdA